MDDALQLYGLHYLSTFLRIGARFQEFIEDPSVAECERLNSLPLGLAECFADYVRPEIIGDSKCDGCNKTVEREKSLALWRLPKILVRLVMHNVQPHTLNIRWFT